jgi:hypothetical protein
MDITDASLFFTFPVPIPLAHNSPLDIGHMLSEITLSISKNSSIACISNDKDREGRLESNNDRTYGETASTGKLCV